MSNLDLLREQLQSKLAGLNQALPVTGDVRQAAVALILRERLSKVELLIIKRALRPGDHWSGNLALPGGRWQPEDDSLLATAIRETWEEVGLNLDAGGEALGRLDTVEARNPLIPRIDVTPYVFIAPPAFHVLKPSTEARALVLNHEVAAAFWVAIEQLKSQGQSEIYRLIVGGTERNWPAYQSEHGPIWGMTERMLTSFLALID